MAQSVKHVQVIYFFDKFYERLTNSSKLLRRKLQSMSIFACCILEVTEPPEGETICALIAENVQEDWNGQYLLTEETTDSGHPVYKMKNEEKYLYFDNNGFYKFDSDTNGDLYMAMIQTGTVDGFPASDVWWVKPGGGYQQYPDGTISHLCTGKYFYILV